MIKGFFRHILGYLSRETEETQESNRRSTRTGHNRNNLAASGPPQPNQPIFHSNLTRVPILSPDLRIIAFQEVAGPDNGPVPPNSASRPFPLDRNIISTSNVPNNTPSDPNTQHMAQSKPDPMTNTNLVQCKSPPDTSSTANTNVPPLTIPNIVPKAVPPDRSPTESEFTGDIKSLPPPMIWDGWPDGDWDYLFSWAEYKRTNNLQNLYATRNNTHSPGLRNAENWKDGYISRRVCLGIIMCDDPTCKYVVRPPTSEPRIKAMLKSTACRCGKPLKRVTCEAVDHRARFEGGCFYRHHNRHAHPPPPVKSPLPWQVEAFEQVVIEHPNATPSQLRAGVSTPFGRIPPVSDISPAYMNSDRISYHRNQLLRRYKAPSGGDDFIEQIQQFDKERPDFIQAMTLIPRCVISVQSPWMLLQSAHDDILEGPLNGIVTDGAHGFWQSRNAVLQVSSVFSVALQRWVPVLMSYMDGHSAQEFRLHFLCLFRGIALIVHRRRLGDLESHLATVMDFSQAQREGFILAFIDLYTEFGDDRSDEELRQVAESLLKGCGEHFRQALTRASNIHAVVEAGSHDDFIRRALRLSNTSDYKDFEEIGRGLYRDYPRITKFLDWWLNPIRAMMIIKSQRLMEEELWTSLPNTTNGAEGGHWSIYCTVGTDHSLLSGLEALDAVSQTLERQMKSVEVGQRTRYGSVQARERVYRQIGRTKLSRDPANSQKRFQGNDGRAPDTRSKLLGKKTKQECDKAAAASTVKHFGFILFCWDQNSCWLDVGLTLLDIAVSRNLNDFLDISDSFQESDVVAEVLVIMSRIRGFRKDMPHNLAELLTIERDRLREILVRESIVSQVGSFGRVFGWLTDLLRAAFRDQRLTSGGQALPYFLPLYADFHACLGSEHTLGRHIQVSSTLKPQYQISLGAQTHTEFGGRLAKWFDSFLARPVPTEKACWRTSEMIGPLCPGTRTEHNHYIISLPVVLIIEFEQDDLDHPLKWNVPANLTPGHQTMIKAHGLIYDIVGISEVSGPQNAAHFTARFLSDKAVYEYDDMRHAGRALVVKDGDVKTHLAGFTPRLNEGHAIHHVVYVLRGGFEAQQAFYESRATAIRNEFKFQLPPRVANTTPLEYVELEKLDLMSADCQNWIRKPEHRLHFKEYVHPSLTSIAIALGNHTSFSPESEEPTVGNSTYIQHRKDSLEEFPMDRKDWLEEYPSSQSPNLLPTMLSRARPKKQRYMSVTSSHGDSNSDIFHDTDEEITPSTRIHCVCGLRGPMEDVLSIAPDEGELVHCSELLCGNLSHTACVSNGHDPKKQWFCEACSLFAPKNSKQPDETEEDDTNRRTLKNVWQVDKPKAERLRPGVGALCRLGTFWYPVRLLRRELTGDCWKVQWWRGCVFDPNGPSRDPGGISSELESNITDAEWNHRSERRDMRLGLWTLAHRIDGLDQYLLRPDLVRYLPRMHEVLLPHLSTLRLLATNHDTLEETDIPILKAARRTRTHSPQAMLVGASKGALTLRDNAAINNWLHVHIGSIITPEERGQLAVSYATPHARTLWCASLMQNSGDPQLGEAVSLSKAWDVLNQTERLTTMDVNQISLAKLERLMFEVSWRAGKAGDMQWGLNQGDHQDGWNPYPMIPEGWIQKKDRELDSDVHVIGWTYESLPIPLTNVPLANPNPSTDVVPPANPVPQSKGGNQRKRKGSTVVSRKRRRRM